jgi:hypothetical protein
MKKEQADFLEKQRKWLVQIEMIWRGAQPLCIGVLNRETGRVTPYQVQPGSRISHELFEVMLSAILEGEIETLPSDHPSIEKTIEVAQAYQRKYPLRRDS